MGGCLGCRTSVLYKCRHGADDRQDFRLHGERDLRESQTV
jgi:hypothetical protein